VRALIAAIVMCPAAAHAACTHDLPQRGVLNFHLEASRDSVVGGIGPNQCGIEVSDICADGRCLAFFDGLSGYVDVTGLASGSFGPAPSGFRYTLTEVEGMAPNAEAADVLQGAVGKVLIADLGAKGIDLLLPLGDVGPVSLQSTGSSGWEGVLDDWPGVNGPVVVYFDRLGAMNTRVEVFATDPDANFDALLFVARETETTANIIIGGDGMPPCVILDNMALDLADLDDPALQRAFDATVLAAGIHDWGAMTQPDCDGIVVALDESGLSDKISTAIAHN